MYSNAFQVAGKTVCINATAVASAPVQVGIGGPGSQNYVITNVGTSVAYLAWANQISGNAPSINVGIPVPGSNALGYPILPGEKETITAQGRTYFSAICENGLTTTVYITPGEGE